MILPVLALSFSGMAKAENCREIIAHLEEIVGRTIVNPNHFTGHYIAERFKEFPIEEIYRRIQLSSARGDAQAMADLATYADQVHQNVRQSLIEAKRRLPMLANQYQNEHSLLGHALSYVLPNQARQFRRRQLAPLRHEISIMETLLKKSEEIGVLARQDHESLKANALLHEAKLILDLSRLINGKGGLSLIAPLSLVGKNGELNENFAKISDIYNRFSATLPSIEALRMTQMLMSLGQSDRLSVIKLETILDDVRAQFQDRPQDLRPSNTVSVELAIVRFKRGEQVTPVFEIEGIGRALASQMGMSLDETLPLAITLGLDGHDSLNIADVALQYDALRIHTLDLGPSRAQLIMLTNAALKSQLSYDVGIEIPEIVASLKYFSGIEKTNSEARAIMTRTVLFAKNRDAAQTELGDLFLKVYQDTSLPADQAAAIAAALFVKKHKINGFGAMIPDSATNEVDPWPGLYGQLYPTELDLSPYSIH